jgi:hypothetical protein
MGFKQQVKTTEQFEIPPGGSYQARFIGLIDLGTQDHEYSGKSWTQHDIFFLWELLGEKDSEGEVFVVGQDYSLTLDKKANLRKMIESYGGKPLVDGQEIDPLLLIGKPCVVGLTEGKSGNDRKFVKVTSVASPTKGTKTPEASRKVYIFDLDLHPDFKVDPPIPAWVPYLYGEAVIDVIKRSKEWIAGASLGIPASGNGQPAAKSDETQPMTQQEADAELAEAELAEADKPPF